MGHSSTASKGTSVLNATKFILNLPFDVNQLLIGWGSSLIVVIGVHHIFNLLESHCTSGSKDPFNAIVQLLIFASWWNFSCGSEIKSQKVKALAFPATISALWVLLRPAIFGVNLLCETIRYCFGAGCCGCWIASMLNAGTGFGITIIPGALLSKWSII